MSNVNDPIVLGFESLKCIKTTPGPGDDEPYSVFFVVDNRPSALSTGVAFRTKVFDGDKAVGDGDTRHLSSPRTSLLKVSRFDQRKRWRKASTNEPISVSPLAEIVATWAISSDTCQGESTLRRQRPRAR